MLLMEYGNFFHQQYKTKLTAHILSTSLCFIVMQLQPIESLGVSCIRNTCSKNNVMQHYHAGRSKLSPTCRPGFIFSIFYSLIMVIKIDTHGHGHLH